MIVILLAGGLLGWLVNRWNPLATRWIALLASAFTLVLAIVVWVQHPGPISLTGGNWLMDVKAPWIPQLGITFHLAIDGLSLLMVALTGFLGMMAVLASWREITERVGFFHLNLLLVLAGVVGVFLAIDLFLFAFFWELMLVPMYFLISIWGHENRRYAALKFFVFTQLSGLLMLLSILGLAIYHSRLLGVALTFDYPQLLGTPLAPSVAMWLMLGFFVAFTVKLPAVPFHTWLPDAHTEAPTAGSVILAGLMLKTGAYGLIRFVVPLFPDAAFSFAPVAMTLAVVGILYGAVLAFAQTDLKRLVAYTSISHLGFVLLGVFAWNRLSLQGAVMQMICHGLSAAALFILVGMIQERIHTRELGRMGGLWTAVPRIGAVAMFFAMALLGLPGLGNFIGEFLILQGAFPINPSFTVIATIGLIFATLYALWMIQRAFFGKEHQPWKIPDLLPRETLIMAALMLGLVWLGLFPQPVIDIANTAITGLQQAAGTLRPGVENDVLLRAGATPRLNNGRKEFMGDIRASSAHPHPQPLSPRRGGIRVLESEKKLRPPRGEGLGVRVSAATGGNPQ
ncbi:MAG: NADH-quinone oxidoreductase subunit M [Armatimonadota bacterium]